MKGVFNFLRNVGRNLRAWGLLILTTTGFLSPTFLFAQMKWICATDSAGWSERYAHASVVFDNKIWVLGGISSDNRNNVWYSTDGVNWVQATDSAEWSGRFCHTVVAYDNKLWVLGGCDDSGNFKNDVWYSTNGVNWTCATEAAGWSARLHHTSVAFNNKIWVLGGNDSLYGPRNDVWYSTDGVNWIQATNSAAWTTRGSHTSVVFDDKIWVIGGSYFIGPLIEPNNDVWYSTDGINWIQATNSAGWTPRALHTSVVFDNKIWVLGGIDVEGRRNDVWYSSDGVNWTQATDSAEWVNREGHASVVFDNRIWVLGGEYLYGELNDVWYSWGLGIEEDNTPNAQSLTLRVSPVLFITNVKITYNLPKSLIVRLSIYDSSGKEVKALFNGKQVAGFHKLQWDGKDNAGKELPTGAYFLKLKTNGSATVKKLVKLE
ncbi:MAG: kelch repeat-containing protein [candidate division WOR-3 bacterium]